MPCLNAMSLQFSRQKIWNHVKPRTADFSTSNMENVKLKPQVVLWTAPFIIPHPRKRSVTEKYIYMPGAGTQAVPVSSIPGYNVRQATAGPIAEAVRQAQVNYAQYGNYGGYQMLSQASKSTQLSRRALKKQQKAERKLEKAAMKIKMRRGKVSRSDLINAESRLGSTIFGPIPEGHRREFFHDQSNIWIWYEGWTDDFARTHQFTVRYEVRPSGVYKKLSAGKYVQLTGHELENFRHAVHAYLRLVKQQLYANI